MLLQEVCIMRRRQYSVSPHHLDPFYTVTSSSTNRSRALRTPNAFPSRIDPFSPSSLLLSPPGDDDRKRSMALPSPDSRRQMRGWVVERAQNLLNKVNETPSPEADPTCVHLKTPQVLITPDTPRSELSFIKNDQRLGTIQRELSSLYKSISKRRASVISRASRDGERRLSVTSLTTVVIDPPSPLPVPEEDETDVNPDRYSDHEDLDEGWRSEDGAEEDFATDDLPFKASPRPKARSTGGKARTINVYRNGDGHFPSKQVAVSQKSLESLYIFLNDRYPATGGVKFLLSIPDGKLVEDIGDIEDGGTYAMSATRTLKKNVDYAGITASQWNNRRPSGGPTRNIRKAELPLLQKDPRNATPGTGSVASTASGVHRNSSSRIPRVLVIVKNTDREIQEKVILNPQTSQTYEEILLDITTMLHFADDDPVIGLFTLKPPHRMVKGFSDLSRNFATYNEFLACGCEELPLELLSQNGHHHPDGARSMSVTRQRNALAGSKIPQRSFKSDPGRTNSKRVLGAPGGIKHTPAPGVAKRRPHPAKEPALLPAGQDDGGKRGAPLAAWKKPYRPTLLPQNDAVTADIHGIRRHFLIPSTSSTLDGTKPTKKLKLDWVYGYRGRDTSNNLHVLASGELVYYVATVAVVYDRKRNRQLHYNAHTEDISCIAIHPTNPYVATGQLDGKTANAGTHVRVWDARSLATLAVLGQGFLCGGVTAVGFSNNTGDFGPVGSLLMMVDDSDKHTLSIWEWQSECMVAKTPTTMPENENTAESVVWGCFHPQEVRTLVTYGRHHVFFWRLFWDAEQGIYKVLRDKKSGLFEKEGSPRFVTSVAFAKNDDVITGDSIGRIVIWTKDINDAYVISTKLSDPLKAAHAKSIFALCLLWDGTLLSGGGSEIKAWDSHNEYKPLKSRVIPDSAGYIRTLVSPRTSAGEGNLLIGTTNNYILEGTMNAKFGFVVQGHSDELWAIATHPDERSFVTAGYDQQVLKWSVMDHRLLWRVSAEKPCVCVAFDPSGHHVIVGTTVGRFIMLAAQNGNFLVSLQISPEQVDCLKYSPDGNFLAIGSHDNNLHVFNVMDDGVVLRKHKQCTLRGHRSYVSHIDWSRDGRSIMSIAGDYETIFWNAEAMMRDDPQKCRDVELDNPTGILSYNLLGAWSTLREGEDINTTHVGSTSHYLAMGDNKGSIRLFRFPCSKDLPHFVEKKAYSGHVTQVRFTHDDAFLISSGGIEAGIFQWAVVDAK